MGVLLGVIFITFFSLVNYFLWPDEGQISHLLSVPFSAHVLVWFWIGLIGVIYGANYAVDGHSKHSVCHVIAGWWSVNMCMSIYLNSIDYRGIEQTGGWIVITLFEWVIKLPSLVLDIIGQGAVDLFSILIVWFLIWLGKIGASIWVVGFCFYLVANLIGHTITAYDLMNLMVGENIGDMKVIAASYDSYMALIFTVMLLLQALGSGGDALLRWSGADVDLYIDIRPFLKRLTNRSLHLF